MASAFSSANHDWKYAVGLGLSGMALWSLWNGIEAFEVRAEDDQQEAPQRSIEEVVRDVKKGAEEGDAKKQYDYGVMLYRGEGMAQNVKEAVAWFEKAAAGGVPEAKYNVGLLLLTGHRVTQDVKRGLALLEEASALGVAEAAARLGRSYRPNSGLPGVSVSARRSREFYKRAADLGSTEGLFMMGVMTGSGQGGAQDESASLAYFEAAAERGHATSMCNAALMYHNGIGTDKDLVKAFHLYQEAAQIGELDALTYFSLFHLYGLPGTVEPNASLAISQLQIAASHGAVIAQKLLAALYLGRGEFGEAITKAVSKAIDSKDLKAQEAERAGTSPLKVDFASVKSDNQVSRLAVAYQLFAECARQNDNTCRSELASMILSAGPDQLKAQTEGGILESRHAGNFKLAYKLVSRAAEEGHARAALKRAVMLYRGIGTAESHESAAQILANTAAQYEDPSALYLLGTAHIQGDGVDKSFTTGMKILNTASAQGFFPAWHITEVMIERPNTDVMTLLTNLDSFRDSLLTDPEPPMKL